MKDKVNVIMLNGPSRSGKDFCVKELISQGILINACSFKRVIHKIAATSVGMTEEEWHLGYEKNKDVPNSACYGKTIRDLMIHVSESHVKPFFGDDMMGRLELERVLRISKMNFFPRDFVFSDSGFLAEIQPFIDCDEIKLTIIHLKRDGCSFEGDSRGYIEPQGVNRYSATNNGDDQFVEEIKEIMDRERV